MKMPYLTATDFLELPTVQRNVAKGIAPVSVAIPDALAIRYRNKIQDVLGTRPNVLDDLVDKYLGDSELVRLSLSNTNLAMVETPRKLFDRHIPAEVKSPSELSPEEHAAYGYGLAAAVYERVLPHIARGSRKGELLAVYDDGSERSPRSILSHRAEHVAERQGVLPEQTRYGKLRLFLDSMLGLLERPHDEPAPVGSGSTWLG